MTRHQFDLDGGVVGQVGSTTFHFRRATAAAWTSSNPVLADGEPGFVTDGTAGSRLKVGDGTTAWSSLVFV